MKISSLTPDNSLQVQGSPIESDAMFTQMRRTVSSVKSALNRIGTAIALGEAGDLDAADAWRKQNGAN